VRAQKQAAERRKNGGIELLEKNHIPMTDDMSSNDGSSNGELLSPLRGSLMGGLLTGALGFIPSPLRGFATRSVEWNRARVRGQITFFKRH
jgi:hypothetical protein